MPNFMDGFMKGYSFMEGIEDNQRKRDWNDQLQTRTKTTWAREDEQVDLTTLGNEYKILTHDEKGNQLSAEEYTKKEGYANFMAKASRVKSIAESFKNKKGHYREFKGFVPQQDKGVAIEMKTFDPKTGTMVADGVPLTKEGGSGDNEQVELFDTPAQFDSFFQSQMSKVPGWADTQIAARKAEGYKDDLSTVFAGGGSRQQAQAPQAQAPQAQAPQAQAPQAQAPVQPVTPDKVSTQPTTPSSGSKVSAKTPVDPNSLSERSKKREPVSLSSLARSAKKKIEGVGASIFEHGVKTAIKQFEIASDSKQSGSSVALDRITGFPKQSGRKFVDNYSQIEKKLGPAKAQEMRKVIADSLASGPQEDQALANELSRLEVLPPKAVKAIGKVEAAMPKEQAALKTMLTKDKELLASVTPGRSFSKQTGGPSKKFKDALIRLHIANPKGVPLDMLERGMKTGRLAARDIKTFAGANFLIQVDNASGEILRNERFTSAKDKAATTKAQRAALKDETAGFEKTIDLKYGSDKKAQGRRDVFAQRLSTSVPTWGIDVTQVTKNYGMLSRAEDIINGHQGGSGFLGFFKDHPSEYPSLTPGIIAQSLGKRTLSEANKIFFTPIQETKAYNGGPIPEMEARNLANLAVGIHMNNPQMTIEKVNTMLVKILQTEKGRNIARDDPASVMKRLFNN